SFMLISNYMGSPKYKVRGSADQEVQQELLPQEGHSPILEVPYEELLLGTYFPGDSMQGNPELTHALHEFEIAMDKFSCSTSSGSSEWRPCIIGTDEDGNTTYDNWFIEDAMPDPEAKMTVTQAQHNVRRVELSVFVVNPEDPSGEPLFEASRVWFRHEDSNYENY
ncbi:MAG: hypothetical protein KAG66_19040, partial [Methylococcales bacterium]|nr:hypothetical protein [Methylococcales bacterium]